MTESPSQKPKFRGNWAPALSSPVKPRNFAQPEPRRPTTLRSSSPDPEETKEVIPSPSPSPPPEEPEEPVIEEEEEEEAEEEVQVEQEEIEEEEPSPPPSPTPPLREEPVLPRANEFRHSIDSPLPYRARTLPKASPPTPKASILPPKAPKDPQHEQLRNDMLDFISQERADIHERELAREMARYREKTNDRALQRQLDNIQFQITSQVNRQIQQEQAEALRQQQRQRRRATLQRMIKELQNELDDEMTAEQQYQDQRRRQRDESIEEFKRWDREIQNVRDRIETTHLANEQDRTKAERADEVKVGKTQKLYYDALMDKDPQAAARLQQVVPESSKLAAARLTMDNLSRQRRGKKTSRPGSEALQRLLDRLQGIESDSDDDLSSDEDI